MAGPQLQRPTISYTSETSGARTFRQNADDQHLQEIYRQQQRHQPHQQYSQPQQNFQQLQQTEIVYRGSSCSNINKGNDKGPNRIDVIESTSDGTGGAIKNKNKEINYQPGSSKINETNTTAKNRPSNSNVANNDAIIVPGSHIEIIVDTTKTQKSKDVEKSSKKVRHKNRPLIRRFISYIRNAFSGVNFSSSHDPELEELEAPPRYRPDSLSALCRATRFSEAEIKRIYRGFKAECPTGVVKEDTFRVIYSQFFPQGANPGLYAHYVFNTLDQDHSGIVSFEDFVQGLSILSRGSIEEKLRWTFSLYDINGDGYITREEMTDIVTAIYDLVGRLPDTCPEEEKIKDKVDKIFQKMDVNRDGVVTIDEFLECCRKDEAISRSLAVFDTAF